VLLWTIRVRSRARKIASCITPFIKTCVPAKVRSSRTFNVTVAVKNTGPGGLVAIRWMGATRSFTEWPVQLFRSSSARNPPGRKNCGRKKLIGCQFDWPQFLRPVPPPPGKPPPLSDSDHGTRSRVRIRYVGYRASVTALDAGVASAIHRFGPLWPLLDGAPRAPTTRDSNNVDSDQDRLLLHRTHPTTGGVPLSRELRQMPAWPQRPKPARRHQCATPTNDARQSSTDRRTRFRFPSNRETRERLRFPNSREPGNPDSSIMSVSTPIGLLEKHSPAATDWPSSCRVDTPSSPINSVALCCPHTSVSLKPPVVRATTGLRDSDAPVAKQLRLLRHSMRSPCCGSQKALTSTSSSRYYEDSPPCSLGWPSSHDRLREIPLIDPLSPGFTSEGRLEVGAGAGTHDAEADSEEPIKPNPRSS